MMLLAACGHEQPYRVAAPDTVGPFTDTVPRRLTFHPLEDVMPSVHGSVLVFGRQGDREPSLYGPLGREQCIAFMPVTGGTITRELCPHRLVRWPDTLVDTWYEPSLSPDGRWLAFSWQRGFRISSLGYWDTYLMVTPADDPGDTSRFREFVDFVEAGPQNPRHADIASRITWVNDSTLLFLATHEAIIKVKGGGAGRVTDTIWEPLALMRAEIAARTMTVVPGGAGVTAYAPGPGGRLWITRGGGAVALLDPVTGTDSLVGAFSGVVLDLAVVDSDLVAIVDSIAIERLRPSDGSLARREGFAGPLHRLAPAPPGRVVVEMDPGPGIDLFGMPPDLWLVPVP